METCRLCVLILWGYITITHSSDPIYFEERVTGCRGEDVTLVSKVLTGNLTQVEWHWTNENNDVTMTIAVNNPTIGYFFLDSPLKERLVFADNSSLTIKELEMNDTGTYTCTMTFYPSGSFEGNIRLTVLDPPQGTQGVIIRIVISVLLVVITMTITIYVIIVRKRNT